MSPRDVGEALAARPHRGAAPRSTSINACVATAIARFEAMRATQAEARDLGANETASHVAGIVAKMTEIVDTLPALEEALAEAKAKVTASAAARVRAFEAAHAGAPDMKRAADLELAKLAAANVERYWTAEAERRRALLAGACDQVEAMAKITARDNAFRLAEGMAIGAARGEHPRPTIADDDSGSMDPWLPLAIARELREYEALSQNREFARRALPLDDLRAAFDAWIAGRDARRHEALRAAREAAVKLEALLAR